MQKEQRSSFLTAFNTMVVVGGFNSAYGNGWNSFTSHYNKKLDKCFILIEYYYTPKLKKSAVINFIDLWDVFEGKHYGGFFKSPVPIRRVENKACKTLTEFENLIRPYREE